MSRFEAQHTKLPGLLVLQRQFRADQRGGFERVFCDVDLKPFLQDRKIRQINRSVTAQSGSVRGLHFQHPPHSELKVVTCLKGEIMDIVVDLREGSPTFLQWHAEILSESNHRSLLIPEGFAHGFQTLSENCEVLYFHTATYAPEAEGAVRYDDPKVGINWPLPVADLSERDKGHKLLADDFTGLKL